MAGWWTLVRIVHVLSAAIWVGSLVAFAFFFRPTVERELSGDDAARLVDRSGRTLGFFVAGVLVPVQLFSGLALLLYRGFRIGGFGGDSLYARLVMAKVVLFFVVVGVSAAHGVASTRGAAGASRSLATLALVGSVALAALGAAMVR